MRDEKTAPARELPTQIQRSAGIAGKKEWLEAAYNLLIDQGVDKVSISTLASYVKSTRTAFYWYFCSRDALLEELVQLWQMKNTVNFISRIEAYAETINEAIFNLFDCWLDRELFDAPLDLAIRNWALNDPKLLEQIKAEDELRTDALRRMFLRFDYDLDFSFARANMIYFTQIGYISMRVVDDLKLRLARMPTYAEIYSGIKPSLGEIERFLSRHQ